MISVVVDLPVELENPEALADGFAEAVRTELDVELAEQVAVIKMSPRMRVDQGKLRRSITALPTRIEGTRIVSAIVSAGEAGVYSDVQDRGRRPGARGPTGPMMVGWVRRNMPDAISAVARHIRSKRTRGRVYRRSPQDAAVMKLAWAVAKRINQRGIKGAGFVADRLDDIERGVREAVDRAITEHNRRENAE